MRAVSLSYSTTPPSPPSPLSPLLTITHTLHHHLTTSTPQHLTTSPPQSPGIVSEKLLKCSRCKMVRYCGKQCQSDHYHYHKPTCNWTRSFRKGEPQVDEQGAVIYETLSIYTTPLMSSPAQYDSAGKVTKLN